MNDGILSQEEIDALLKGDKASSAEQENVSSAIEFSEFERDTIGEIGNIAMGTAATTLSTLLGKKVAITTPSVYLTTSEELSLNYPLPYVVVQVRYTHGLSGSNVFIVRQEDAAVIADLMMGGDGISKDNTLDEIKLSAVSEAMNQMMGSATTSLSSMFDKRIDIAPPEVNVVDLGRENLNLSSEYMEIVQIRFKMEIQDLVDSEIMQIIPIEAARDMIRILVGDHAQESALEDVIDQSAGEMPQSAAPPEEPVVEQPPPQPAQTSVPQQDVWMSGQASSASSRVNKAQQYTTVQPVQFAPLQEVPDDHLTQNIGLIMDVPLDISVELGRTRKTIKDILELTQGSIIQLEKLAGEPVDLLVNGKPIAKGEVVVIDENYGIRITTILSPMDRMNTLQ